MNSENPVIETQAEQRPHKGKIIAGSILILVGVINALANWIDFGSYIVILIGLAFLAAGVFTRKAGFIIPGGVVGGIGLGILVQELPLGLPMTEETRGGLFLLCFAAGWFLITLLTRLFTPETHTWALIPGGIMAVIGGLILMGGFGLKVLEIIGNFWPLILIAIGAGMLFKALKK